MTKPILAAVFVGATFFANHTQWHTPPDQWDEPRTYLTPFDSSFDERIQLKSEATTYPDTAENVESPNHAYKVDVVYPDYAKNGPWNTVMHIHHERDEHWVLTLTDHNNWNPAATWINEKLLYVRVWWGRVVGTDIIIDVERGDIIYKEMVNDGQIAFQQWRQSANNS